MSPALRGANAVMLVAVLFFNGLAGAGTLSGESIGLIANRYVSYFLPADYVFGIWSVIYLGLAAFAVAQLFPSRDDGTVLGALGGRWLVNGALNIAWVTTFSFALFLPAWVVMVALLVNLVDVNERIGLGQRALTLRSRVFVAYPFALYLAWISVALIANTFQLVNWWGWDGFGVPGRVWAAVMIVLATGLAGFMVAHRRSWVFPLVFAWAFIGIAVRYPDVPPVSWAAWAGTVVCAVLVLVGLARSRAGALAGPALLAFALALGACRPEPARPLDSLAVVDSLYVDQASGVPFTGAVARLFPEEPRRVQIEGQLLDGVWHGDFAVYHPNGRIRYMGSFERGDRCGPWVENADSSELESVYEELVREVETMGLYPPCRTTP